MSAPAKTIEVDPTDEGPKVRPKRQLTEAQLAALKKGREKLAEKRKLQEEAHVKLEPVQEPEPEVSKSLQPQEQTEEAAEAAEEDEGAQPGYAPLCIIM